MRVIWALGAAMFAAQCMGQQTSCAVADDCVSVDQGRFPVLMGEAVDFDTGAFRINLLSATGVGQCYRSGGGSGGGPTFTSFAAVPAPAQANTNITMIWSTTGIPSSGTPCLPISGPTQWTALGPLPAQGGRSILAAGQPGQVLTYTMRCTPQSGAAITASTTVTLTGTRAPESSTQLYVLLDGRWYAHSTTLPINYYASRNQALHRLEVRGAALSNCRRPGGAAFSTDGFPFLIGTPSVTLWASRQAGGLKYVSTTPKHLSITTPTGDVICDGETTPGGGGTGEFRDGFEGSAP